MRADNTMRLLSDSVIFQAEITINFLNNYLDYVHYEPHISTDLSISRIHGYLKPTATVKFMVNNRKQTLRVHFLIGDRMGCSASRLAWFTLRDFLVSIFRHQLANNPCDQLHTYVS